jgi:RHS repeat-associated protein
MSVTVTGATDAIKLGTESFTNVEQTAPLDVSNGSTGTTGNPSISLTTTQTNDVIVSTLHRFSTTDASTNRTALYKDKVTSTLAAASYQLATNAGSYSDTYTGSATADWCMLSAGFKPVTSGGGSGATTTRFIHTDQVNGSSVVTDASGLAVVETMDYYPYGGLRIDAKASGYSGEKRKAIGQEYDALSTLSYYNARYFDSSRAQFESQDPVARDVGSMQKMPWYILSVTGNPASIDQTALLSEPQMLNFYSYSTNNPITKSDPSGKYLELSLSGTAIGWSGAVGIRGDLSGVNAFGSVGAGIGTGGYPISLSYTPGGVSHQKESTIVMGGEAARILGVGVSSSGTLEPSTVSLKNQSMQYSIMLGLGADVYLRKEISTPISLPAIGSQPPPGLEIKKNSSFSTPNYSLPQDALQKTNSLSGSAIQLTSIVRVNSNKGINSQNIKLQ